jgi:hypothetical protein
VSGGADDLGRGAERADLLVGVQACAALHSPCQALVHQQGAQLLYRGAVLRRDVDATSDSGVARTTSWSAVKSAVR